MQNSQWLQKAKEQIVHARLPRRQEQVSINGQQRMVALHIIAANRWKMTAMDVEKAFLKSAEMDIMVYVYPPEEEDLPLNTVWKLLGPAYGLNDAARGWHKTLRQILLNLGIVESNSDKALFQMKTADGKLHGIIVAHVDDLLVAGDDIFYKLIDRVKTFIKMGKERVDNFKFCYMSIVTSRTGEITIGLEALDKTVYIKNVPKEFNASIIRTTAFSDNLSLRWVLYSGKATKELRLRRELAAARDLLTHDQIRVRHVSSDSMLADPMTKPMAADILLRFGRMNNLDRVDHLDKENVSAADMLEAELNIPMLELSKRLESIQQQYNLQMLRNLTTRRVRRVNRSNSTGTEQFEFRILRLKTQKLIQQKNHIGASKHIRHVLSA